MGIGEIDELWKFAIDIFKSNDLIDVERIIKDNNLSSV